MFMIRSATAALLAGIVSGAALAAPVQYTFTTGAGPTGNSYIVSKLGNQASVSGTFTYNNSGTFTAGSSTLGYEPGYAVYATALPGQGAYYGLSGQVNGSLAGLSFSDIFGSANVGNNIAALGGVDLLTLTADAPPKVGQETVDPTVPRQLQGFTIGDYALQNVRLIWSPVSPATVNFLDSYALPQTLPSFQGRLWLEFTPIDPNRAGMPYQSNTVYFGDLQVTAVPEPQAMGLALAGLMVAGLVMRRRAV